MRKALALIVLVVAANAALWTALNRPAIDIPDWNHRISGAAWSPYPIDGGPDRRMASDAELRADMERMAQHMRSIRTYTTLNGIDRLPAIAEGLPLTFMLGAWVDNRLARSREEIERLIAAANRYPSVTQLLVGNEALLFNRVTPAELTAYVRDVRARVHQPVSVAEPAAVWLREDPVTGVPDPAIRALANSVDFLAVHILPYWEDPHADDLAQAIDDIRRVQERFPDRPIVITEIGHPSDGRTRIASEPSVINQARFLRGFFNYAARENLPYYIMEAIDQPWKTTIEGSVGPYWGMMDAHRELKFPLVGPVWEIPQWPKLMIAATLVALLPMLWAARRRRDLRAGPLLLFLAVVQLLASGAAYIFHVSALQYLDAWSLPPWAMLVAALAVLAALAAIEMFDLADVLGTRLKRVYTPALPAPGRAWAKVSIHLPIHNEPPAMVIETLNSLAALDYPDFEVIVVDNNTKNPDVWQPVEAHCQTLAAATPGRFRFFHVDPLAGFKAGALNFALAQTAPEAAFIAVVDSDYVVDPQWLKRAVPAFDDPEVGFVQAPQDHRDGAVNAFKRMMFWEYAGFFEIGMVQRNERNALIQHGTMVVLRRAAMGEGWATWCIVEDAEMGLRLVTQGWRSVYIRASQGKGLMPDHFGAYKVQRFRWAYGAVQILRRYWRDMLLPGRLSTGGARLSPAQRYHFLCGWAPWFADAASLIVSWLALAWTAAVYFLPDYVVLPHTAFLVPIVAIFFVRVAQVLILYRARVACSWREQALSAIARPTV
jgi:exo-beta-1,3-glucanase (GH17 family)/cellulose synthase/poly-beta-1,6-N-acetylglucosamine synthase-like glycosyltransferase